MRRANAVAWLLPALATIAAQAAVPEIDAIRHGLRHVVIVPVEPPPLVLSPPGMANEVAKAASVAPASGTEISPNTVAMIFETPGAARAAGNVAAEVGDVLAVQGNWIPTRILADVAASELQERGAKELRIRDGVEPIPGVTDRSVSFSMHNWYGPLDHYYRSDKTPFAYAAPDVNAGDLVLEVSLANFEYAGGSFILAVRTKLVDPSTGAVLAKAVSVSFKDIGKPADLFSQGGQGFKTAFSNIGGELVKKDLKKLGF